MEWHSKRSMRVLFFFGAMFILFGLGGLLMGRTLLGVAFLCIGLAAMVIGMTGIAAHLSVEMNLARKRSRKK